MRDVGVTEGLLRNLPPSKELMVFYKSKLASSRGREELLLEKWKDSGFYYGAYKGLQVKLEEEKKQREDSLETIEDLKDALHLERTLTRKLYAQNHGFAVREHESQRKVQALLQYLGKSQGEIAKVLDSSELDSIPLPSELEKYVNEEAPSSQPPRIPSRESLSLELSIANKQLVDQEKLHLEQLSRLNNEIRTLRKKKECLSAHYEVRLEDVSKSLVTLERVHKELAGDALSEKEKFHARESLWEREKEKLVRKVQFLEQYGLGTPGMDPESGGFHTSKRTLDRKASNQNKAFHDANRELKELRATCESYKSKILSMENDLDLLKEKNTTQKEEANDLLMKLKSRVDVHKGRFEDLEHRRKLEMEGYQADIKILTEKLRTLQRKLVSTTLGKSKEHNYLQTIRQQEDEIDRLNKLLKKNPDWR